jgi:hypothetical protein
MSKLSSKGINIMGMFQVRVKVTNPSSPEQFFEENFWVALGALYSFIPEDRLRAIGIEPLHTRELILTEGRRDRRLLGEALFTIEELHETLTCPVTGALFLLGATTLENFGVEADTTTRKLKPVLGIIGG